MSTNYKRLSTDSDLHCPDRFPIRHVTDADNLNVAPVEALLGWKGRQGGRDFQIFAIQHTARRMLPYGKWTCSDGREVVFNREYQPIFQRVNGVTSHADRDELVEGIVDCVMYYDDSENPVNILVKHLGHAVLTKDGSHRAKQALLRCFAVMREFSPKEHYSVNSEWSLLR